MIDDKQVKKENGLMRMGTSPAYASALASKAVPMVQLHHRGAPDDRRRGQAVPNGPEHRHRGEGDDDVHTLHVEQHDQGHAQQRSHRVLQDTLIYCCKK